MTYATIVLPFPVPMSAEQIETIRDRLGPYVGRVYRVVGIDPFSDGARTESFGTFVDAEEIQCRRTHMSAIGLVFAESTAKAADDDTEVLCQLVEQFVRGLA